MIVHSGRGPITFFYKEGGQKVGRVVFGGRGSTWAALPLHCLEAMLCVPTGFVDIRSSAHMAPERTILDYQTQRFIVFGSLCFTHWGCFPFSVPFVLCPARMHLDLGQGGRADVCAYMRTCVAAKWNGSQGHLRIQQAFSRSACICCAAAARIPVPGVCLEAVPPAMVHEIDVVFPTGAT